MMETIRDETFKKRVMFKKLKYFQRNFAFTLAEILITLGIIGVVAALAIPAMMQVAQDQIYASGFKKNYAILLSYG